MFHCSSNNKTSSIKSKIESNGFAIDEPTTITNNEDSLNRLKYVQAIVSKIKETRNIKGSFSMGLVGAWGSGKTTILNTINNHLDNDSNIIKFELNVWKCSTPNQIIETLFKLFRENLRGYSFTINNKLNEYVNNLLKSSRNESLNLVKNLSETFFPNPSLELQYDMINSEIKNIGKKIVVLVDDLDRLDKDEVFEVIRLIRNTANFSNTFFVVAYDRNYVLSAIESINSYQPHKYLEKIFQIEFTLPPISRESVRRIISDRIKNIISSDDFAEFKRLSEGVGNYGFFDRGSVDLTNSFVVTLRDATRFINSLLFRYLFLKGEVYFPDFYNIELIRFKHPEFIMCFYKEHSRLLSSLENKNSGMEDTGLYHLESKKDKDGKDVLLLEEFILSQAGSFKFDSTEVSLLIYSFSSIFPNPDNRYSKNTNRKNGHLAILQTDSFDRYFITSFEEQLSENSFTELLNLPLADSLKVVDIMVQKESSMSNLYNRLSKVQTFENRSQFEKVIQIIFYFSNRQYPESKNRSIQNYIGFNGDKLAKIIEYKTIKKFYEHPEEYKAFLLSLFKTTEIEYTFTNDFVDLLLRKLYYYVQDVFSADEISSIIYQNYERALEKSYALNMALWFHFMRCDTRNENLTQAGYTTISYPKNLTAIRSMRKFVWNKDLDTFILYSLSEVPFDKEFYINENVAVLFKSLELFVQLLKRDSRTIAYKEEFLDLYSSTVAVAKKSKPKDFFKVIPVKLQEEQWK